MASKHTRALLLFVGVLTAAVACGGGSSAPKISAVSPASIRNSLPVTVTIDGKNFYRKIVPDAANSSHSTAEPISVTFSNGAQTFNPMVDTSGTPSSSQVVVTIPADVATHTPGAWSVTVHADGGDATMTNGFTFIGPPSGVRISSATEALPGTADVVTLSVTSIDGAGSVSAVDNQVDFTIQLAGTSANSVPSVTLLAGESTNSFNVTDPRVEAVAVSVTPSVALVVSQGTATFVAGPPRRLQVVSASTTLVNSYPVAVVLEDVDRNVLAIHSTAYSVTLAGISGGCPSNSFGANAMLAINSSAGTSTYQCGAAGNSETIKPVFVTPGGLSTAGGIFLGSNGVITFN